MSLAQLRAELEAGRSLAQIADAMPGESATGLIDARVRAREADIEAAVAAGRTNAARAAAFLSSLGKRIAQEVQRRPGTPQPVGHAQTGRARPRRAARPRPSPARHALAGRKRTS